MAFLPKELAKKNGLVFNILDENVKEDFSIWDNNKGKFFRDGEFVAVDNTVYSFEQVKFMNAATFKANFPDLRKSRKSLRQVMVNGVQYTWAMPMTASEKLSDLIGTIRGLGSNPFTTSFKMTYHGDGLGRKYNIEIVNNQSPVASNQSPTGISVTTTPQTATQFTLTEIEKKVVDAIRAYLEKENLGKVSFEQLLPNFTRNGISEERSKLICSTELKDIMN